MSPKWMSSLVRARQSQEDAARQRLALARRAADRARDQVLSESSRIDALQTDEPVENVAAFVAAVVALQSAAATHAAAIGEALQADAWAQERQEALTEAAIARHTAEELHERARRDDAFRAAGAAQRALDEVAASVHRRAVGEVSS